MAKGNDENVFKKALQEYQGDASGQLDANENLSKKQQLRTIGELNLVPTEKLERMPKIRDLTVHDLNDLAAEFAGIKTGNERVGELSIEDVQDIEQVFFDFKVAAGRDVIGRRPGTIRAADVDVSCCCCTPCCCCAATDMSHTG